MLVERTGNLLDTTDNYIIHGVNCKGVFGAGIAGQIAKKYPSVKDEYIRRGKGVGWALGDVQYLTTKYPQFILNVATQNNYGRGQLFTDYNAISVGVTNALTSCVYLERSRTGLFGHEFGVSISRIGCGLGGGDWGTVKKILTDIAHVFPFIQISVWNLVQDNINES